MNNSQKRSYNARTIKTLWGRAAGRCAFSDCRIELLVDDSSYDPVYVMGENAHIEASSDKGPRADIGKSPKSRDEYENLILLCKNCHGKIDSHKIKYSKDYLKHMKYEHEAWVRTNLPERGKTKLGWNAVILEGIHPIDENNIEEAISPGYIEGKPFVFKVDDALKNWVDIHSEINNFTHRLFKNEDKSKKRYAIFPLAPVSSCISLGYAITNRPIVNLFQYHRDSRSWCWPKDSTEDVEFKIIGIPKKPVRNSSDVSISISLSAHVNEEDIPGHIHKNHIELLVAKPSVNWLSNEKKLRKFETTLRDLFEICVERFPKAEKWHIFCAVPAPVAVAIGQQLNPTMSPFIQLYEFTKIKEPKYNPSILLVP